MDTYCTVSECETPSRQGRRYCELHEKRHRRGQSLTAPKAERLDASARFVEAAIRLADAETNEDFEKARRDALRVAKQMGPTAHAELVRQGMTRAKACGVRLGRPPSMTYEEVLALVAQHGSLRATVRVLGVGRNTLRRALRKGPKYGLSDPLKRAA